MRWLLVPYKERRTYLVFVYLLLGLPIGVFDFVLIVTGGALGLGLLITLLGIPVLIGTLLVAHALATFERRLAWSLLDAPMPRLPVEPELADGFFWKRLRSLITSRRTWMEVGFLLLRLPMGILDFTIAVVIVSLIPFAFVQTILVAAGLESDFGAWTIDTVGESLLFLPISALFALIGPRLLLGWGAVSARFATAMLGIVQTSELKRAVGEVLARTGKADAFEIMDQLEMRLGRGPFLTATRLEATLLALGSNGVLSARREGRRTTYALADGRGIRDVSRA
jgi:hypothetical protein